MGILLKKCSGIKMRIGINLLVVIPARIGGTETYLRELIKNLACIDNKNDYVLFVTPWNKKLFSVNQKNFKLVVCHIPSKPLIIRVLYEQIILPFLIRRNKIDIFHFPASVSSLLKLPCPIILTLHDLTPFLFPKEISVIFRYYWRIIYPICAQRADFIITISNDAKTDIVRLLKIPEHNIKVIYHGSEKRKLKVSSPKERILQKNKDIEKTPYILWVGKTRPHKNLPRLLYAYDKLVKAKNIKYKLVMCGIKGSGHPSFIKTVEDLRLQDKVIFKGYVSDNELELIYANASLFIFPSLSEGFGLPILEAMSCGVPVITSNYGAMAEVASNAAFLVDPYNIDEIAEAIYKVLIDKNLREDLIKKGLERVKQFSWEKTARETLKVYKVAYRSGLNN